jgi:hypothetical protein
MIPEDVLKLIKKYAAGRIPPLVEDGELKDGLINGELLEIYQRGFAGKHLIPLGILVARPDQHGDSYGLNNADYRHNKAGWTNWTQVCRAIRSRPAGEEMCQMCDRRHATVAVQKGTVVAYMCNHGLIDFAMPIFVEGKPVAVLFTGQRVPHKETLWPPEFLEEGDVFPIADVDGDRGQADAWEMTVKRLQDAETTYGFQPGELFEKMEIDLDQYSSIQVSPSDVVEIQTKLEKASRHLSALAQSTYELEKSKAVSAIRAHIATSVGDISADIRDVSSTLESIIRRMANAADIVCEYFGIDYLFVLNINTEKKRLRLLLSRSKDAPPWPLGQWSDENAIEQSRLSDLHRVSAQITDVCDLNLSPYSKLPFFDWVLTQAKGKAVGHCIASRLDHPGLAECILLAGRNSGLCMADFRQSDKKDLQLIIRDLAMVANVFQFVSELHAASEAQDLFLEDVAHDIRNPIQVVLVKAEQLKHDAPEVLRPQLAKLAAQIRRIQRLSQNVWLLEQLRHNRLPLDTRKQVMVYQIIRDAIAMVADFADDKNVKINVSQEIASWREIQVDRILFFQAVLNLLDNAIKYSRTGTEVWIDGEMMYPSCRISVVNRGLGIKEEDLQRIFHRGYRTPEAKTYIHQGSGIGLCIVDEFAKRYGRVEVKSSPIYGTKDYVTEFRLVIEGKML